MIQILKLIVMSQLLYISIFPITQNQTDNFQNITTMNWTTGGITPNPNPITLISSGGFRGAGEIYIRARSSGGLGAGSKLVIFNQTQWTGNYISSNITSISMRVNNTGSNDLQLRLAFDGTGGWFVSVNPVSVTAGSGWHSITFSISSIDLSGGLDYNSTMSAVSEFRILHVTSATNTGTPIVAQLDVDDITAAPAPLPVELSSFLVSVKSNSVVLKWGTATEINLMGFNIESSLDKLSWKTAGFIQGVGNSAISHSYSFTDAEISRFYRLKIIDNNGEFKYSFIADAGNNIVNKFNLLQNYPNPFNPSTQIVYNIPTDSWVKLFVYSVNGELVKVLVDNKQEAGIHNINFNPDNLPSGVYMYKLNSGDQVTARKMIFLK